MNALDYLLKANLYGLLFVGCYWLFLRRHTFFNLNRFYLLTAAILSLVLPMTSLPTQTVEIVPTDWPVPVGVINLPVVSVATTPVQPTQATSTTDWETMALFAYILIAALLVVRLAVRVGRLFWLIYRSKQQVYADYILVEAPKAANSASESPTFSFFRYLVINPADTQNELIIRHELVHIRQYHSADVLGLALLRALFWACPALWFIDRMLRQVHEFLADREASQPTEYARFLVEYAFGLQPDALTKGFFNPSLLKQRIQMLYQTATPRWALGKYTLVLPLVLGLLAMTTDRKEVISVVDQFQDKKITVTSSITSAVTGTSLTSTDSNKLSVKKDSLTRNATKPHSSTPSRVAPSSKMTAYNIVNAVEKSITSPNSLTGAITYSQNNSKNARFALYNDVKTGSKDRYGIPLPDSLKPSQPTVTIRTNGFDVGGTPLYIIDGMYASKEKMDKLDPNDILNIDVQKGPKATVLHGEKARYGVVTITTKRK
jgi:beta-lactamase regulating signal transducer with metallopeptidase domain